MQNLSKNLKSKLADAGNVVFLGIGSELAGDDVAGCLVARSLAESFSSNNIHNWRAIDSGAAPESFTGEIVRTKPSHVVFIDAADLKVSPGAVALIELEKVGGVSFSTHRLPTRILADYLIKTCGCKVIIIGIEPKSIAFLNDVSKEVEDAVKDICEVITSIYVPS